MKTGKGERPKITVYIMYQGMLDDGAYFILASSVIVAEQRVGVVDRPF